MTGAGFHEQKSIRPGGLALVIAMHATALGALALVKGPEIFQRPPIIDLINIRTPPPPKQEPPPEPKHDPEPERPRNEARQQPSTLDRVDTIVDTPIPGPIINDPPLPQLPPSNTGAGPELADATPDLPPRVGVEAQFDPRYAADQQPPYPASEQRAQRDGSVRLRLRIGADGRVKAIERLSATSEAFWQTTQRHALARWRFRPATVDGRPVESTKVMNVFFRIEA